MYDLKACVVCFNTDVKLFNMNKDNLRREFQFISGIQKSDNDGLPHYLCYQCSGIVRSFMRFREKCQRANFILKEILSRNKEIKLSYLKEINGNHLGIMPPLSYMSPDKTHLEEIKFHWTKQNRNLPKTEEVIPTAHCGTIPFDNFDGLTNLNTEIDIEISDRDIKTDVEDLLQEQMHETEAKEENIESYLDDDGVGEPFLDNDNYDEDNNQDMDFKDVSYKIENTADIDGSSLDEEYATMVPITMKEAQAAVEVYKMFANGTYKCEVCNKTFNNENRLTIHSRMHDKHISGIFECVICKYYYKTEFLLKTHMTEKHMFKYICKKCPEVSFHRSSAKQHYILVHLRKGNRNSSWYDTRPSWLNPRGGKRIPGVTMKMGRKPKPCPDDFPIYTPLSQEEQYLLVKERQKTRNYLDAKYKCNLCCKGFRLLVTYEKHMKKHDPAISGPLQCDMCKLCFENTRKMYKHMDCTHLYKYSCQMCSYVCTNRCQAQMHYRWHKNVTYSCPHCDKVFTKATTRLTHIRIKHPSLCLCNLCGHSYVSEAGLYCHKQLAHTKEEVELSQNMEIDKTHPHYCADCKIQFLNDEAFLTHLGSSFKHSSVNVSSQRTEQCNRKSEPNHRTYKPRRRGLSSEIVNNGMTTSSTCEVCGKLLANDVQARKHYQTEHPDTEYLKRYMCDVCGHTTRQYANLLVHMRTHTNEKPYECPHCDRRFSMPSNRDRHLVVHTGEKRYQCQHCNRRFTQSSAVKLHIQTVHLKIPYAPWNKKNRKRRKELEAAGVSTPLVLPQTQQKIFETPVDYLNAYMTTYNDE